jgi:1-acyl-sn-glycerol-3-phosphate acyltransferase
MIRSAWVYLNLLVATVPLSIFVIVASLLGAAKFAFVYEGVARFWARWILWASGSTVRLFGVENIAPGRPQIIAPNHVSWFDVLALAAYIPKRYRFIAKKELRRIPFFGRAWQAVGHIAIDRSDTQSAIESLDHAARLVREDNSCIILFPEGTRSSSAEMLPFKKGAFMLALHTGLDIVPTGVQGTRAIMPKHSWRVSPGRIIVRFGRPVTTSEYDVGDRDLLMARVRAEIDELRRMPPPEIEEAHVRHHQRSRS